MAEPQVDLRHREHAARARSAARAILRHRGRARDTRHTRHTRHHTDVAEYCVEQHATILRDKMAALRTAPATLKTTLFPWGRGNRLPRHSFRQWAQAYLLAATSAVADGVEEARVADLGGVLREFDIDPCDDVTERTVLEGPSRSLCRSQGVVGNLLQYHSPLSL